jgi:hypothetical protein
MLLSASAFHTRRCQRQGANDMSQTSLGMGRRLSCLLVFFLLASFSVSTSTKAQQKPTPTSTPANDNDPFKAIQWRLIGPFRGGRSTAVTGVASQPMVYYFGATGGGVWKTIDGGINWEPISDKSVFTTCDRHYRPQSVKWSGRLLLPEVETNDRCSAGISRRRG